ncbi:MAG: glycosyltransferase family 9 protein [Pseudomonadota bacterium]
MTYVLLTYLFAPLLWLLLALKGRRPLQRILVIQTAKIGDMICSTPVFREIKAKYPHSHLAVLLDPMNRPLVEVNPNVDEAIAALAAEFRGLGGKIRLWRLLRRGNYDAVIALNPSLNFVICAFWALVPVRLSILPDFAGTSYRLAARLWTGLAQHRPNRLIQRTYLDLLRAIGIESDNAAKEVFQSAAAEAAAAKALGGTSGPLIGIGVSSGNKLKELGSDKIVALIRELHTQTEATVVFIGSLADRGLAGEIMSRTEDKTRIKDATGLLGLAELPALLQRLALYVGVDSGITYMADALGVPVVSIAGPCNMQETGPTGPDSVILQKDLPCVPCAHIFRAPYTCRLGTRACIQTVTASEISRAAVALLRIQDAPK